MLEAEDTVRPHQTRRRHQQALARSQRRKRQHRRRRSTRIRMWRAVNSLRFWTRTTISFICVAAIAFWAKFAVVYDIPPDIQKGHMYGISAYVAEKPWWFGPLAFDLGSYSDKLDPTTMTLDPLTGLIQSLGQYQPILESPTMIWIGRNTTR